MRWLSGRASDSRARGRRFDTCLHRVVSLSKDTFTPQKVLVIPRKRWLLPDMTEKLFTWTLNLKKTKLKLKEKGRMFIEMSTLENVLGWGSNLVPFACEPE